MKSVTMKVRRSSPVCLQESINTTCVQVWKKIDYVEKIRRDRLNFLNTQATTSYFAYSKANKNPKKLGDVVQAVPPSLFVRDASVKLNWIFFWRETKLPYKGYL